MYDVRMTEREVTSWSTETRTVQATWRRRGVKRRSSGCQTREAPQHAPFLKWTDQSGQWRGYSPPSVSGRALCTHDDTASYTLHVLFYNDLSLVISRYNSSVKTPYCEFFVRCIRNEGIWGWSVCPSAPLKSTTDGRIFIKFGMDIVPLVVTPNSYFVMSYNR